MVTSQKDTVWPANIFGEARNQKHNTQASLKFVAKRNIDQWTYRVERRENSDANYIFSLRLKYTLLDHWPKHVNIRTFSSLEVHKMPVNPEINFTLILFKVSQCGGVQNL